MKMVAIFAALTASSVAAQEAAQINCEDASAFYYYSTFSSQMIGDISGTCAKDLTQDACVTLLQSTVKYGDYLKLAQSGDINAFLYFLKESCPDHFPEDPTKFEGR